MHLEYAVDPDAIGKDWSTFKDLFDRFGTDKGRLISRFPKKWAKMVIDAAVAAKVPDADKARIIERLKMETRYKAVRSRRNYDTDKKWICNALREHDSESFRAIICNSGAKGCNEALPPKFVYDAQPLMVARRNKYVSNISELVEALLPIALVSNEIDLVDRYFDYPGKGKGKGKGKYESKYIKLVKLLFAELEKSPTSPKTIRVHYATDKSRPSVEQLAFEWNEIAGKIVPKKRNLELYGWSKLLYGEREDEREYFHDRFFLTDIGGIQSGIGFGVQPALLSLMDIDVVQKLRGRFVPGSNFYPSAEEKVAIDCEGAKIIA